MPSSPRRSNWQHPLWPVVSCVDGESPWEPEDATEPGEAASSAGVHGVRHAVAQSVRWRRTLQRWKSKWISMCVAWPCRWRPWLIASVEAATGDSASKAASAPPPDGPRARWLILGIVTSPYSRVSRPRTSSSTSLVVDVHGPAFSATGTLAAASYASSSTSSVARYMVKL